MKLVFCALLDPSPRPSIIFARLCKWNLKINSDTGEGFAGQASKRIPKLEVGPRFESALIR
jgi:hypothetical protein